MKIHVRNQTSGEILADRVVCAGSAAERRRGLLGRAGLEPGEGLWISPCEAIHSFGMKFPIDVFHLNRAKIVTKVRSAMKPWSISISLRGSSVLELPAGTAKRTGTSRGDRLVFTRVSIGILAGVLSLTSCVRHQVTVAAPVTSFDRHARNAVDTGDGDYQLARLRAKLVSAPNDLTFRLDLAAAYQAKGYGELALDHYRLACGQHPDSAEPQLRLARTLLNAGHVTDGVAGYRAFLGKHPESAPLYISWLGIMEDDRGDWQAGEAAHRLALERATDRQQDRDYLHNNLGFCLLHQGRATEAAGQFRAALALNPKSELARDNLATSLIQDSAEALVHFQSVQSPAAAHNNLAALSIERGSYPQAHKELLQSLMFDRAYGPALRNLKILSELEGKPATMTLTLAQPTTLSRVRLAWDHLFRSKPATASNTNQTETLQTASRTKEISQ